MAVGEMAWWRVLNQARHVAALGGPPVPDAAADLKDLPVTGPADILAVSRASTRAGGAILMSSGGTTGRPKLTCVAYHQAIDRLLREWRPLAPGDTLLNLFTPGRLWASHYYMQALAERSGCDVIPAGPYGPDEVTDWLPWFAELGVTAAAGTPTALADLAQGVLDSGQPLPLRAMVWMAEPWTPAKLDLVRAAFPDAGLWGNYGSVETYVIATNTPDCDTAVLHLMADQVVEPDDGGALLTRAGGEWTVPSVRYRLGDRIAPAECRCGRPDGLRVLGRADDAVKLHSALMGIGEILRVVTGQPGVAEAQLVLIRGDGGHAARRVEVHFTGEAEPDRVQERLLREVYNLGVVAREHPGTVATTRVARLGRVERTNKVPPMLWRDHPG
jgi:phenylacetate-CoA ligase